MNVSDAVCLFFIFYFLFFIFSKSKQLWLFGIELLKSPYRLTDIFHDKMTNKT